MNTDHLDSELVAAWMDGSLDQESRAAAEAHAADCARCRAVLAAMVRIEPEPARTPAWFGVPLRWLMPAMAATAAIAIAVVLTRPAERAEVAPPSAPQILAERKMSGPPPEAPAAASQARPQEDRAATGSVRQSAPPATSRRRETRRLDEIQTQSQPAMTETVAPPAAAPTPPPTPPAAPRPLPATEPPATAARQVLAQERFAANVTSSPLIVAPGGSVQWRIRPPAAIERSIDGGNTWSPQSSGVTTALMAGSAPSTEVAWIVGRAGVVLSTTDGQTWRRLSFPEPLDLMAVTATDARSALVTATDGRTFRTTDGGATWTVDK